MIMCLGSGVFAGDFDAGAANQELFSADELICYTKNGATFTEIDGEEYMVLVPTFSEAAPNAPSSYAAPTYGHDLANGIYTASVDLTNGNKSTPNIKRTGKSSTILKISGSKTISFNVNYYNILTEEWISDPYTDIGFNVLVPQKVFQHDTLKAVIEGIRFDWIKTANSSLKFNCEIGEPAI